MRDAGLTNFDVSSGRSSSSSSALFSGIPLHVLFSQVGWGTPNTFITYYMHPLLQNIGDNKTCNVDKSKISRDDPHSFSELWKKNCIRCRPNTKAKCCKITSVMDLEMNKIAEERCRKLKHANQRVHNYKKRAIPVIPPNMLLQSTPL